MKEAAEIAMITIFSTTLVFHLLVLVKVIPYAMVWGGRLKSDRDMYRFEVVSITVNLLFMLVILVKAGILPLFIPRPVMTVSLWFMFGLFVVNTAGNIMSKNKLEKTVFTPVTIALSVLILVVLFA
jgi:hypothetical protein